METLEKTGAASPKKVSAPLKRRKPDSGVSLQKGLLTDLPGDLCGYCNERCTESGKQGQAIECDLCGAWLHALCEGVNTDHYQSLVSFSSNFEGLTYLCKLNSCQSRFKQIVGSANQKIESHDFSSDYCSMLVVPKYFLSHSETESAVIYLTDKWIFVVRVI